MPSTGDSVDIPPEPATVARRYHRRERALSATLAFFVAAIVGTVALLHSIVLGVLGGVVAVALLRIPVFKTGGAARLLSDADPDSVGADFTSATPPVFPFQWGIADRVRSTDEGAVYEVSYLFGLRTARVEVTVDRRGSPTVDPDSPDSPGDDLVLTLAVDGDPWGTYTIAIEGKGSETLVAVGWTSDRRFGLRWLPQWLLARSYRSAALAAQGYRVAEYESSLSL